MSDWVFLRERCRYLLYCLSARYHILLLRIDHSLRLSGHNHNSLRIEGPQLELENPLIDHTGTNLTLTAANDANSLGGYRQPRMDLEETSV